MSALKIEVQQACVYKNSVVDMGGYILYAAPDGLVAVSGNDARVVTQGLISAKQWNADFKPTSIRAFRHEDTYVAFYTDGSTHKGWYTILAPNKQPCRLLQLALRHVVASNKATMVSCT